MPMSQEAFRGQRELAQYVVVNGRLQICTTVQLIGSCNAKVTNKQFKLLKKEMDRMS